MRDSAVRRWSAFHKHIYRSTRGLIGRRLVANDMLLLTTVGHESGREHTVPLLYLSEGARLVVVASYGGRPNHPDWYVNLRHDERVMVQVGAERWTMRARRASTEERDTWWPRILAAYEGYSTYQSRSDREIPVVILEPLEEA